MDIPQFQIGEMVDFDASYLQTVNPRAKFAIVTKDYNDWRRVGITVFLQDGSTYFDSVTPYCILKRNS